MAINPFGDEPAESGGPAESGRVNPFGDDEDPTADPARRLESAAARFRELRSHVGAEGMTGTGMRALLDELSTVMRVMARAFRE